MKKWNDIKQNISGLKDISSIGISHIVGSGISALFWLFIASSIGPEKYGEIHYFLGIAGLAQILSLLATSNTMTVYSAKNYNVQSTLFLISLITGSIASIVIFTVYNRIDVSLLVLGYVIFESINSVMLGRKQFSKYAKFILIQKFLTLFLGVGLYYLFDVEWIIIALVFTYVPYIPSFFKEIKRFKINFQLISPNKKFIFNNYVLDISESFGGQIDKVIIAPLLGFILLGNYSLSIQFFTLLMLLPYIFYKYILPLDSKNKPTKKIRTYGILISIGICILGITVISNILPVYFPDFYEIKDSMSIISLGVIPATLVLLYGSKFLAVEKSKFLMISKIIGTVFLITGFLLLGPIFGIVGLASIFVLSYIIEAIIILTVYHFKFKSFLK